MIDTKKLELLHTAAQLIESEGINAIQTVTDLVGEEVALALLVAYLRIGYGSTKTFPAPPEVRNQVDEMLKSERLVF